MWIKWSLSWGEAAAQAALAAGAPHPEARKNGDAQRDKFVPPKSWGFSENIFIYIYIIYIIFFLFILLSCFFFLNYIISFTQIYCLPVWTLSWPPRWSRFRDGPGWLASNTSVFSQLSKQKKQLVCCCLFHFVAPLVPWTHEEMLGPGANVEETCLNTMKLTQCR